MKFAIISDTHGNVVNFKKVINWLKKNNIGPILHCGDIGNPESLEESLVDFNGELYGVLGNMDKDYKIDIKKYQQPHVKIYEELAEIEIQEKRIAIIHRPDRTKELAMSGKYDFVFYGHTHKPWEETEGQCRIINPGEAAGQIFKPTFAIYDTATDRLELKIIEKL